MSQSASKTFYWRDPTNGISTPIKTIHDNFRNAGKDESNILVKSSSELNAYYKN